MDIIPSVKAMFPSLKISDGGLATLSLSDVRKHLPSIKIVSDARSNIEDGAISMSISDLRKILRIALSGVQVDEEWYLSQVPGLSEALRNKAFQNVTEHFYIHGFLEGRLPRKPHVDEAFYVTAYKDVAQGIKAGKVKSAFDHYVSSGYLEGRLPSPDV